MEKRKFLIIIQASPQDMGRAFHGLSYGQELHEAGHEVDILFDGTGSKWITEFGQVSHPFHYVFKGAMERGIIKGACAYCSNFLKVDGEVKEAGVALKDGGADGHMTLADHVANGYELLIL